uniref:TEPSIN adaptor related protein complex 4 accessory protein n=1 Tax=Mastacembelus armatus TaxID=205130 RepID=A0A7N8X856_9TELE
MATFMERLAFLQKVPTLMKATADDEKPCPGYLFQEIGKISHESSGCGQCLLEYLLERLQAESCHVKLKVLKIFVHLCGHGSNHFLTELRRNSTFIQQASVYSGPPDPIHGTALYQKVRNTAQVRYRLYLVIVSVMYLYLYIYIITFSVCRKWPGCFSQIPFPPKVACPPHEQTLYRIKISIHSFSFLHVHPRLSCLHPAVTQRCPGQVGGGWEESDSGNSSSHSSSQDIVANSRASVGSKSASTGSQMGASRESSGDLSDRVEALQLGDCGQEMALISRLTEGSRVFLSREESQHFIKECSILNCEVVVELLSSKLQDSSNTIKMRALCAVACLITSDLLSLEQMFGATQRRLHQLSEGPPGPVANKATKILRQLEALMGGTLQAARQDAANSSHQVTTNQLPTSTYSDPLLPIQSADTNLSHRQPNISPCDVPKPPNHPTSSSGLALAQIDSSQELLDESEEKKLWSMQQERVRTAAVKLAAEDPELLGDRSFTPPSEPKSRPSLFSGMELVTKVRPLCERETSPTETDGILRENSAVHNSASPVNSSPPCIIIPSDDAPSVCSSLTCDSSQPVSAFSFLNF